MREGVIQFELQHEQSAHGRAVQEAIARLSGWRTILRDTGLLGADPARYGGLGFGNISHRVGARSLPRGRRTFVVSGSQTSGIAKAGPEHFACVHEWAVRENQVVSSGPVRPSSESLTHATIYDYGPHVVSVLHVHSPDIWAAHRQLRLPATPSDVDYGTTAMADAAAALFRAGRVLEVGAFVMLGHEDGVVAFGRTVDEAGCTLMRLLAAARAV